MCLEIDGHTDGQTASLPKQTSRGCSHLGVGPAALPQARSHSRVPRPRQSELGPHPISRHPSSQALPRNGDPLLRSLLGLQRAHRPEQRPSRFLKTVLDVTSYSSSFQSLSIGPLHVPHSLLRVPGLLDLPARGLRQGKQRSYCARSFAYLLLYTHLVPKTFNVGNKNTYSTIVLKQKRDQGRGEIRSDQSAKASRLFIKVETCALEGGVQRGLH